MEPEIQLPQIMGYLSGSQQFLHISMVIVSSYIYFFYQKII